MADLSEFNDTIGSVLRNNATRDLVDGGDIYLGYIGDTSAIQPNHDVDMIAVNLEAGDVFSATTNLFTARGRTIGDTDLRMFDKLGQEVDSDPDGGDGLESALHFTAPADGTYYIAVSGAGNTTYDPNLAGSGTAGASNFAYQLALATRSFDGLEYIASYDDLRGAFGANAELGEQHFASLGAAEGRDVSFDGLAYIASHGDLIGAFGADRDAGARHFIEAGAGEGREISFDAFQYLANYSDLQQALGNNLEAATLHYITTGFAEGRVDDALFIA